MFAVYILLLAERKRRKRQIWSLIFDLFGWSWGQPFRFTFGLLFAALVNNHG